jgi:hypothetical protein
LLSHEGERGSFGFRYSGDYWWLVVSGVSLSLTITVVYS